MNWFIRYLDYYIRYLIYYIRYLIYYIRYLIYHSIYLIYLKNKTSYLKYKISNINVRHIRSNINVREITSNSVSLYKMVDQDTTYKLQCKIANYANRCTDLHESIRGVFIYIFGKIIRYLK